VQIAAIHSVIGQHGVGDGAGRLGEVWTSRGELVRSAVRGGPQQVYAMSLKLMLSSGQGRFWLRPSAAARALISGG